MAIWDPEVYGDETLSGSQLREVGEGNDGMKILRQSN